VGLRFPLATYHGNQSSIHDPLADQEKQPLTTLKLFNRIRDFKRLRKALYPAPAMRGRRQGRNRERAATSEDAPVTLEHGRPYSISKIVGEFYSVYYHKQHGLRWCAPGARRLWAGRNSVRGDAGAAPRRTVWRNVKPTFIYKALKRRGLPLQNHGEARADFI
jgi:GDP-D-mannose dehydratase